MLILILPAIYMQSYLFSQFIGERVRNVTILRTSALVRCGRHIIKNVHATYQVAVCQIILRIVLAIHFHGRDVTVRLAIIISLDHDLLAVFQVQRHVFEQRRP